MLDALIPADDPERVPEPEEVYLAFSNWAETTGRPLYPHQDEALSEILEDRHVIAATPTGSGKSMIALAAHTASLARGGRSYYTAPLKALVSEKFFELVRLFGADNVGMVTGDTSINAAAPIICCTAEILANQSLREGEDMDVDCVIMDEFHYYADPQRGWAWQVPLLELPQAQMVLLSATLGDVSFFVRDLRERTGREVAVVDDAVRPVPLEMEYVVEPIGELLQRLVGQDKAPVYVVHFSQKEAVERATSLLSVDLASKSRKAEIVKALGDFRFGGGFGATLSRLLRAGIGVHHAGMLPRYRRLVERLTQAGLLPIVCGTDTLGVGINVPIRTVLMTSLVKYDGRRMRHVSAREFHQIAGRAGRAGFDTVGFVRVLAPEHEVDAARERARLSAAQEAARDAREAKRAAKKSAKKRKGPGEGEISWTRSTFERLVDAAPEQLTSRFEMTHAMVLNVLAGAPAAGRDPGEHLVWLARNNDDPPTDRNPHLRRLGEIYTSMKQAGVVEHVSSAEASASGEPRLRAATDLPDDFALNQPLSPFALAALELLDPQSPTFALDVVSVIESVLEDPRPLLFAQEKAARAEAVAAMKAQGMEYDERMAALEEVTWSRPLADLLGDAFTVYLHANPWIEDQEISPKSVVREMIENALTFTGIVGRYDVGRSEGIVLRYLTDAYRALRQIVPDELMTDELRSIIAWLSALIRAVDSSLLDEWEAMSTGQALSPTSEGDGTEGAELAFGAREDGTVPFSANRHAFRTAIRGALFERVEAMSRDNVEALARLDEASRTPVVAPWGEDEWDAVLERYWAEHEWIGIDQRARALSLCSLNEAPTREDVLELAPAAVSSDAERAQVARIEAIADAVDQAAAGTFWLATQTLFDPEEDMDWRIVALVDVPASDEANRVALATVTVGAR